ncbi:MAG: O-antigen ligase family protein [Paludibacteraceae bacterium]|nr:O-antigen ligase family protein [Paludibacteraceae bacterium]
MTVKQITDTIEEYSLYLFAFFCCFPQKISSIFFVTWGSCWIIKTLIQLFTQKTIHITWNKDKLPSILLLTISILGLITALYAADYSLTFKRIFEQRLSLLLVPIAIIIGCTRINLKTLLYCFIYGNLCFFLVSFIHVIIVYWEATDTRLYINFLFYCTEVFHDYIHRSYSNLNAILGFIGLGYLWCQGKSSFLSITTVLYTIPALLFCIVNNSRGETIALLLVIIYYIVRITIKSKKRMIFAGISLLAIILIAIHFFPENRTIQTIKELNTENSELQNNPRIQIWKSAKIIAMERPLFGYGVNNFEAPLNQQFDKADFLDGTFYEYNTHNQYICFQLEYGIIGVLLLIALLISMLTKGSSQERKFLFAPMTILWLFSFLFESFLDRYNGCATFSLTLLILSLDQKEEYPFHFNKKRFYYLPTVVVGVIVTLFLYTYYDACNQEGKHVINQKIFKDDFQGGQVHLFNPSGPYTFTRNNQIFGYQQIAFSNLTDEQEGVFEIEVYVTKEFNGNACCISTELSDGSYPILCIYDLNKKEEWQKFEIELTKGPQTILCFDIHTPAAYKEKAGTVYLRNPRITLQNKTLTTP